MEVRAWLLEPFLLMQTGLHWTLLGSAGSPQCEVTSKTGSVHWKKPRSGSVHSVIHSSLCLFILPSAPSLRQLFIS